MYTIYWILFYAFGLICKGNTFQYIPPRCGEQISDLLTELCDGRYHNSMYKKSGSNQRGLAISENVLTYRDYVKQQMIEEFNKKQEEERNKMMMSFPFRPRQEALGFIKNNRFKRGIVDECCRKSCSRDEVMSYCEA